MAFEKGTKGRKVLHEFKTGTLRRGTGRPGQKAGKVKDRKQALAIAFNEQRKAGGGKKASKGRERRLRGKAI